MAVEGSIERGHGRRWSSGDTIAGVGDSQLQFMCANKSAGKLVANEMMQQWDVGFEERGYGGSRIQLGDAW